ncbi:MAG: hypothetical protein IH935_05295 [Acidobacteria bacterium]|nr:hypothetical protein [Acidobacteriota bacterium]MCH8267522.1 hypothetical protein [Acidobacteriota bacterium]
MLKTLAVYACLLCFVSISVCVQKVEAQGVDAAADDMEARFQAMEERIQALEAEVELFHAVLSATSVSTPAASASAAQPASPAASPGNLQAPSAPLPVYGGAASQTKLLNPDIGVIGNFTGASGHNRIAPSAALSLAETEISLQAIIDPYAQADFFLALGEEGVEVEEGYITFPALPGGLLLKAGRMRAGFGKVNALHNHSLPWIDRPLVAFNLLGGDPEEADIGIKDAGFSVSRILPVPGETFWEVTAEMYRGDSGTLFQASRRSDLSAVGRLRAYRDLTESTNLEVGGSYARGHNDQGTDFITQLFGVDATLRWKPLRRAIYRSFLARAEVDWSRRQEAAATQRALGLFVSAEYQFSRRWYAGGRFDWSERARNAAEHDSGGSLLLSYWPSEFNQIRGQLRRTRYAEGFTANEFLFQFLFTLGAHGAHPF